MDEEEEKKVKKHKPLSFIKCHVEAIEEQCKYLDDFRVSERYAYIYCLIDPTTSEIRYFGKTERPPRDRYKEHVYQDYKSQFTRKTCWIVKLVRLGLVPVIKIVEQCKLSEWIERETHWIWHGRNVLGLDLLNETDGGEGLCNPSEATREKMRQPHTDEARAKISKSLTGHYVSDATKAKLSIASSGENNPNINGLTQSHKNNIGIANSGHDSNNALAQTKTWQDPNIRESRVEGLKKSWGDSQKRENKIEGIKEYWQTDEAAKRKETMKDTSKQTQASVEAAAKRRETPEFIKEMQECVELYLKPTSMKAMEKILGKSHNYIKKRLTYAGVVFRTKEESFNNQYTINKKEN